MRSSPRPPARAAPRRCSRRPRGDHGLLVHVAEQGDLALDLLVEEAVGAAEQDVGLDADRAQVAHAVLRRLGLQLAGRADERHQRQVDVERVLAADVLPELADGLDEGQALDVADRAADLDEHHVHVAATARMASLISLVMCGMTCTVRPR
jgi:type II secretory pathway component PulM